MNIRTIQNIFLCLILVLAITSGIILVGFSQRDYELASFYTSLQNRSPEQIHNAKLATRKINGTVLEPGQIFSFNKTVGPWTMDQGYKKAPASYEGEMVPAWGGGVCQVSSTLYNAALLAGLNVTEREHHFWPSKYLPPGRDAAVAYETCDLKFQNIYREPLRILGELKDYRLNFRILAKFKPEFQVKVFHQIQAIIPPVEIIQPDDELVFGERRIVNRGHRGYRVTVYRTFLEEGKELQREIVSQDYYQPKNRIVLLGKSSP